MDSPLNQAHVHVSNAEDMKTRGLFVKAVEEHELAAELFKRAMDSSTNDGTRRALRMLYVDQSNAAKDLQRKIAELQVQGKDPNLPQLPSRGSNSNLERRGSQSSSSFNTPTSSFAYLPGASRHNSPQSSHRALRLSDSQVPIGESYMMLGQNSDAADPFKDFWQNVEGLLDKFSSPVAFATAPLSPVSAAPSSGLRKQTFIFSSESESSEPEDLASKLAGPRIADQDQTSVLADLADALGEPVAPASNELSGSLSSTIKPGVLKGKGPMKASTIVQEVSAFDDDDSDSDTFFVVPVAPSVKSLQTENTKLKDQLKAAEAKLATAQQHIRMRAELEQQLRDGLLTARSQMQHRLGASAMLPLQNSSPKVGSTLLSMQAGHNSPTFDMSFPNLKLPTVPGITPAPAPGLVAPIVAPLAAPLAGPTRDREATLLRRTRELEEELRVTREENEKQRAQIVKFRERWAKLKESAKKKKSARAAAEAGRIDEEPEEEDREAENKI
ncbi:hypothetical protein BKA62DRAFT_683420 [Auriculariales sp. MPI-PUGE-AT-0066]|nr:hypothetical protein BKA62DRAFT_683420 [Auriculariales sp. MPI-PUGE-AT-0066]